MKEKRANTAVSLLEKPSPTFLSFLEKRADDLGNIPYKALISLLLIIISYWIV